MYTVVSNFEPNVLDLDLFCILLDRKLKLLY